LGQNKTKRRQRNGRSSILVRLFWRLLAASRGIRGLKNSLTRFVLGGFSSRTNQ